MNAFEEQLPHLARINIQTRLHIVSCEHMRLLECENHLDSLEEVLLAKVSEVMEFNWKCPELFEGLAVRASFLGEDRLTATFTSPFPEVAAFLNSLEPAECDRDALDDYCITDD